MSYWEDRAENSIKRMEGKVNDYSVEMIDSFEKAKKDLQKEINAFYGRYANENKISLAEAQKQLDFKELKAFKGNLKEYTALAKNSIGTYNLELNNLSIKARITRLQALEFECDTILQRLYQQLQDKVNTAVKNIFIDEYYHNQFDIENYTGFQYHYAKIADSVIKKVLETPVMGADISARLWRQDLDTGFKIRQTLNNMFTTGKPPQDFADELQKIIGKRDKDGNLTGKKYEAYRLLYNESSFAVSQADLQGYIDDDIDEYIIIATLDFKTSPICREMDGKHFLSKKAILGENFPPLHCNCRSTTAPYIEGIDTTRIARGVDEKNYYTTAKNYKEWYQEQISLYGEKEVEIAEKKIQNRTNDDAQYQKHKEILGKNVPKTFDLFQEMKYNNSEEYKELKGFYYYKKKYPQSNKIYYEINNDIEKLRQQKEIKVTGTAMKPQKCEILYSNPHAELQMQKRKISLSKANEFQEKAVVSFQQRNGEQQAFYSQEGFVVVDKYGEIKTTGWLDDAGRKIIEVVSKYENKS